MAASRKIRWAESLACAAVGLALLLGIVPLQRALAPALGPYHPWWEIPGLVLGGVFLIVAVVLVVPPAWYWDPIRARIPFDFQSPIVREDPIPKVQPVPTELG